MNDFVESCPQNLTEVMKSSTRLDCGRDKYGNDQYICVPNIEKSGLVEFCYKGIMGIIQRGNCLETTEGNLFSRDCSGFIEGCPDDAFRSNEHYNYPACQQINTQGHCYLADPSCSKLATTTRINVDHEVYSSTIINIQTASLQEYETAEIGAIVGGLCARGIVLLLLFLVIFWKRKQRFRKTKEPNPGTDHLAGIMENGPENDLHEQCTSTSHERISLLTNSTVEDEEVGVNSKPEKEIYDVSEDGIYRKQEKKTQDVTEAGVSIKPLQEIHDVTEAAYFSQLQKRALVDTKADINSKREGKIPVFETVCIINDSEKRRHGVLGAEINNKSEERSHGNTDNNVKNERGGYLNSAMLRKDRVQIPCTSYWKFKCDVSEI
ncbi:uncharacterized protein LOC134272159 isoform X2 [Saccostrea cucullata]|uniref:uncharacterized protein LOC134272159 isoform X2 n=1 Tax=Saccostrea cuccullata TaxID=36930 RepID=UPI002ED5D6FB